jgi:F0F1-type ATP synthase assembly protein I
MSLSKHENPGNAIKGIESKGPERQAQNVTGGMGLLAEVSTLAWNLVIPIVGGVMLGHYLDNRNNSGVTWSLSLLVLGVIIAFSNLYNLYIEQGQKKIEKKQITNEDEKAHAQEE